MVRRVLADVDLQDIHVVSNGGRVWIDTRCGRTTLYADEAITISEILLSYIHARTKLEILRETADTIFKMFGRTDVDLSMVNIKDVGDGFVITVGRCNMYLDYDEALQLVYELLTWSIIGLKKSITVANE
jgi:hypothetical protein